MTKPQHADHGLDDMPGNGPRLLLADHHRGIEKAYLAMLSATYADDSRDLVREFRCFESAVLEHVAAEEEVILPFYELFDAADAALIRADHARIREELTRAGIETDLHAMRVERMKGLVEALRAHSAHEDSVMYPWAQVHLPLGARRTLFLRLTRSLQTLVDIAERAVS